MKMSFRHIVLLLLSVGCCGKKIYLRNCPEPIDYSEEFQKNLVRDLEKIDSYYINQVVIDWFNLNNALINHNYE